MARKAEEFERIDLTGEDSALGQEAVQLARRLFGNKEKKKAELVRRLIVTCNEAMDRDILIIHSPGGWGSSGIEHLINWERSVVDGIQGALAEMGFTPLLVQYFRSGNSSWSHLQHTPEQVRYIFTGKIFQAEVAAAELKFIAEHLKNLKIILLGVSQGAAFNNTVMKHLDKEYNIYSIELGIFFTQLPRRVITKRTLAIDSNGLMLDPVVHRNLKAAIKAYLFAPFSWTKYKLAGEPVKFTYCINVPGHDYNWKYPEVQGQIIDFLKSNLKNNNQ